MPSIDPVWHARAQGAYGAVARADGPDARWMLQGWMLKIKNIGFGPPHVRTATLARPAAGSRLDPNFTTCKSSRTDSFVCCWQGSETGALALSRLKAYATAAPPGNFILLDMDETGAGQWQQWHGDWGLPFIWTSLHVFGGNMGIKGNLSEINEIPFAAPPIAPVRPGYDPNTEAVGVGYVRDHSPLSVPGLVIECSTRKLVIEYSTTLRCH